jgi:putative hydrolase of the HAD superfamily
MLRHDDEVFEMQIKITPDTFFVFDLDDTLYHEIDFLKSAYRHISKKLEPFIRQHVYDEMLSKYQQRENVFQWILNTYGLNMPSIDKTWLTFGVPAGLITDGRSLTQRNKLKALGIETYFQDIIISEEFGSEKPDERNYLYFEKKYPGKDFYFFGDNLSKDFQVPCRLGWKTICILDSGNHIHKQSLNPEDRIDYRISKFQEILLA